MIVNNGSVDRKNTTRTRFSPGFSKARFHIVCSRYDLWLRTDSVLQGPACASGLYRFAFSDLCSQVATFEFWKPVQMIIVEETESHTGRTEFMLVCLQTWRYRQELKNILP